MPSKYEIVSELAAREANKLTATGASEYMSFLRTAANNYKYSFREQLLIYAQKPDATACADINTWNRLGRWVNKGTKGIALLVDNASKYKLRYVFDISDTNSREGYTVTLWRFQDRYAESVMEALENSYGALEERTDFVSDLIQIANAVVEDNYSDYAAMLQTVKSGSFLEELDELNTETWLKSTVKSGVAFMLLTRCGYNAWQFISREDFSRISDFNTPETIAVLGDATSDISEMVLREIEVTVRALQKEEKRRNRTFANAAQTRDNVRTRNEERSADYGREADLPAGGRLSDAERSTPGGPESGQVWDAAARLPEKAPEADLHRDAPEREPEQPFGGDRPAGDRDGGQPDREDGESGERDGEPESVESDALGAVDEQHSEPSRGESFERSDLQLIDIDAAVRSGVAYYRHDEEKQEILRTCKELQHHRLEIVAYFDAHEDSKERGNFIRSFFDAAYVEQILENGQRVGYRAYGNALNLWRGAYLTREFETFMRWTGVADTIYGMMLMGIWLDPDERPLPTEAEQMTLIAEDKAERDNAFSLPQDAIDFALRGGGMYEGSKYRIYEHFRESTDAQENIKFLKHEYGEGGHSDAIPGTGLFEDHDGKGIRFWRGVDEKDPRYFRFTLKWPKIEKRIRQLIAADNYLSKRDKEVGYPAYLRAMEVREQRGKIADEFNSIVDDYTDYLDSLGQKDEQINKFMLRDLSRDFRFGSKTAYSYRGERTFVLVDMREAMQTIIAANTHLTGRCEAVLEQLSGPYAMGLEPTEEELNPPPEPAKELRISLGDTVYLGTKAYEVLSLGDDEVRLTDPDYPLFTNDFPRADFERMVAENPLNDNLFHEIEEPAAPIEVEAVAKPEEAPPSEKEYDLGFGALGNGMTVWNRLEEEHGDYKTIAHIENDRTISFYDAGLPESVRDTIRHVAATDTSILTSPLPDAEQAEKPHGNELWQAYSRTKAEQEGSIVLYQVGDFYEALGDDAKTVAEALDITLTTRNVGLKERVPMCGVPVKSGDTPLIMLNDRGFDVFLVDSEGGTYPLPSYHKDHVSQSKPVGRVDYHSTAC